MNEVLDKILLGDNVCKDFYENYNKKQFKDWLLSILPEVEDCRVQQQDNPWHIYSCLDHILHSVEEINKQTKGMSLANRRVLAYTMFLHDIGKPSCYLRRFSKLYDREVDSFFGHNKASEEIAKRVLQDFNFNKQERREIRLLVNEHDIFMFMVLEDDGNKFHHVVNNELIDEYIKRFNQVGNGQKLMKWLVKVGIADNKAQNPEMTKNAMKVIDVISNILYEKHGSKNNEERE